MSERAPPPGSERKPLYSPPLATIEASQMTAFVQFCEAETGLSFDDDAAAFHRFSVAQLRRFWSLFLRWSGLLHEGAVEPVCTDDLCERAAFFPNLRLSYAENLLRIRGPQGGERPAVTARDASGRRVRLTRGALRDRVIGFARALDVLGVVPGDRLVAVVHNDERALIAALGASAVGASLSTCSPDMGAFSLLGRFAQLAPSLLLCHLRDLEAGATAELGERVRELVRGLPTLKAIVVLDDGPIPTDLGVPAHRATALEDAALTDRRPFAWRRFPFAQPLFTLFSSGTTGAPKCIQHGAGGTLLEHVKEHRLHGDLRPEDKLFFHTSCAWMMWNWVVSALATGAEIVLYAGPIRGPETLWRLVSEEGVTAFGTSPAYLQMCQDAGFSPARELPLESLRVVLSTGSILYDGQFDWFAREVGPLPLQSISGGTDILGCFVLGHPGLPVHRGEAQCRSLGMDVQALREDGAEGPRGAIGELVCRTPFPSRPLGFHGDADGSRFHDAYFAQNPGVWTHGDLIEISHDGGVRLHGRSDGVLKVHGVRIGPAEIYRILQEVPEITACLAVEQNGDDSAAQSRLVLLVVLREGVTLDGSLKRRIREVLRARGSVAHVPEVILAVGSLPTTHSGKRSERAARDALNGTLAPNAGALRNPESLEEIRAALEESRRAPATSVSAGGGEPLERRVQGAWERVLDIGPLSPDDNFFDLGGTSLLALRLCHEIRAVTGWEASPSTLLDAPTIARMTETIRNGPAAPIARVVALNAGGHGRPLFLVHGLAGDVLELRLLAQGMAAGRPVFGVRARGLDGQEPPCATVEEMATDYVEQVRARQPVGPYALGGYSFGGLVAFEMARRLHAAGQHVDFLGLLDTNVHHACVPWLERVEYRALRKIHRASTRLGAPRSRVLRVARERLRTSIEHRLHATVGEISEPPWLTAGLTEAMVRVSELVWSAFRDYRPGPYDGVVTFFRARTRPPDYCDPVPVWAAASPGSFCVCDVPGDHFSMLREPNVDTLAERLAERLGLAA